MGLFSSVLHVLDKTRDEVLPALDAILGSAGYLRDRSLPVPVTGPRTLPQHTESVSQGPYYLVSPLTGRWLTLIESHFALHSKGVPWLADLGNRLSGLLSCYTLTLMVHDDDLFLYNFDRDGKSLDGYNSCPQYFEQERLSDTRIAEQRHSPEVFQPLLPAGRSLDELRALLNRGWWRAYDAGQLDQSGVVRGPNDGFVFEGERMTAFGTLLQLHGANGEYPFAAWGESANIPWPDFVALRYRRLD